mmetsp:Transcript_93135/g.267964  ORF Transcript_93135/g.267964 Transcript_93135/m.267964 type:complete len:203 (+) Transcript_93135:246-854(+)
MSFSLKSTRPAWTLAKRCALVLPRDGVARSSAADIAPGMRPVRPRSPSETSASLSLSLPLPLLESSSISSAFRFRPSCISTERWSRNFRSFLKSSEPRTSSVISRFASASGAATSAPASGFAFFASSSPSSSLPSSLEPLPLLPLPRSVRRRFLATNSSRPSMPSAAWVLPYSGARTSPRLTAIAASRPRRDRCSNCGSFSR